MSQSRQYLIGLCLVLLVAIAITPAITKAETATSTATTTATSTTVAPAPGKTDVSSLLTLLKSLMKQVEDLQKQLAQVRTELKDGLHEGMTDEDIKKVQELLATDPTLYPRGLVTGYYGPMTKEAVMRFQTRHGLEVTGEINAQTKALLLEYFKEKKNGHVPEGLLRTQGIGDQMKLRIKARGIECEQEHGVTSCKNHGGDNKGKNRIDFNSTSTINNNIDDDSMEDEDDENVKTMKQAKDAIDDAKNAIDDLEEAKANFEKKTKAITSIAKLNKAHELLTEAEDYFDEKDYDSATDRAEEAEDVAKEGEGELDV